MTTQQLDDHLQNIDNSVTTLADLGTSAHELDLTQRTIEINTQAHPNTVMHELNCVGVLNGHPVFITVHRRDFIKHYFVIMYAGFRYQIGLHGVAYWFRNPHGIWNQMLNCRAPNQCSMTQSMTRIRVQTPTPTKTFSNFVVPNSAVSHNPNRKTRNRGIRDFLFSNFVVPNSEDFVFPNINTKHRIPRFSIFRSPCFRIPRILCSPICVNSKVGKIFKNTQGKSETRV